MISLDENEVIQKDYFGYLDYKNRIEFNGGYINPLSDFDSIVEQVNARKNSNDGFIYPQTVWQENESGEKIPNTERVDWKQFVPATHEIVLNKPDTRINFRKGRAALIIHLLGYLFGLRQQFHGWWFDGRLHINKSHSIYISDQTVSHFINHCKIKYESFTDQQKKLLTNLLYMHGRSPMYQWDWEKFTIEYMVFDGLYKLQCSIINKNYKSERHDKRIEYICMYLGLAFNAELVNELVGLRNQLFHETLWSNSQPGTAVFGNASYHSQNIRRLNQLIIPAIFEYKNDYLNTHWWTMGKRSFNQPLQNNIKKD